MDLNRLEIKIIVGVHGGRHAPLSEIIRTQLNRKF